MRDSSHSFLPSHLHELENAEIGRVGGWRCYRLVLHDEEAQDGEVAVQDELLLCKQERQLDIEGEQTRGGIEVVVILCEKLRIGRRASMKLSTLPAPASLPPQLSREDGIHQRIANKQNTQSK